MDQSIKQLLLEEADRLAAGGLGERHNMVRLRRYVLLHGKIFVPAGRPKEMGLRKRRDSQCFVNAVSLVAIDNVLPYYVEGYALPSESSFLFEHHAWNSDDGKRAIDTTWRTPGALYFGVVFTAKQAAKAYLAASSSSAVRMATTRSSLDCRTAKHFLVC
jgi:hypothetical protein